MPQYPKTLNTNGYVNNYKDRRLMESNYLPVAFNLLIWINLYAIFITFSTSPPTKRTTTSHLKLLNIKKIKTYYIVLLIEI